jgi:hypothetical protein
LALAERSGKKWAWIYLARIACSNPQLFVVNADVEEKEQQRQAAFSRKGKF